MSRSEIFLTPDAGYSKYRCNSSSPSTTGGTRVSHSVASWRVMLQSVVWQRDVNQQMIAYRDGGI